MHFFQKWSSNRKLVFHTLLQWTDDTDTDNTTPSTQTSTRSMSETEVKNAITRPMSLQKKMTDIELPSTTTAVAVRKEIK